ncbi:MULTISPECIES: GNAT family N-acetyltransferase [Nocardioides]|uniref:GNAT family N-acetyltransferase n=1 Tax=Nocardioides TaxID=1839 RepID=UPI00040D21D2|nr:MULTISPECIES: GNAT family protein [Nocardioides]
MTTTDWAPSPDRRPAMRIAPLNMAHAQDICTWQYSSPYHCYDMTGATPAGLLDPVAGFNAVLMADELIGFRSFGADGQVPGWAYDDDALDTGGGLRPSLIGQGFGQAAIQTGLAFGTEKFHPQAFRVTVASFNARALRTVASLGFRPVGEFESSNNRTQYVVLSRPTSAGGS